MVGASQLDGRPDALSEREFLSLDEVLSRLQIGRTAGYELARRQEFPFKIHRIGRQYRVSERAFNEAMHGSTADAAIAS